MPGIYVHYTTEKIYRKLYQFRKSMNCSRTLVRKVERLSQPAAVVAHATHKLRISKSQYNYALCAHKLLTFTNIVYKLHDLCREHVTAQTNVHELTTVHVVKLTTVHLLVHKHNNYSLYTVYMLTIRLFTN